MNTKKIFFSYSRTDAAEFAVQLARDLKDKGFNVWIDQMDIPAGNEWDLEIQNALETCDDVLFIESERSVASNNVLDEVYFALEQQKKIIPVIYHDSKTPFRLQRLQHVDFTREYETGLACLLHELNRQTPGNNYLPDIEPVTTIRQQPFLKKHWQIPAVILLAIIACVVIFYLLNSKKETVPVTIALNNDPPADTPAITTNTRSTIADEPVTEKNETKIIVPVSNNKTSTQKGSKPLNKITERTGTATDLTNENLVDLFSGEWRLAAVSPKAASNRGYLRITKAGDNKVNIQGNFQFYYFKTNDTAYFVVFNGYAACTSCVLKNDLIITDKDIAIGSNKYSILKKDVTGEGKAGDTVLSAGGNNSIKAFVSLHLPDKNTVVIKVRHPAPTPASNGLTVPPFQYSFRFRKNE